MQCDAVMGVELCDGIACRLVNSVRELEIGRHRNSGDSLREDSFCKGSYLASFALKSSMDFQFSCKMLHNRAADLSYNKSALKIRVTCLLKHQL